MEFVLLWVLFGFLAMIIAVVKGRSGCGWFALGVIFGPFSLVVLALPDTEEQARKRVRAGNLHAGPETGWKKCLYCAEAVRAEAIRCRYCGSDLPFDGEGRGEKSRGEAEAATASPANPQTPAGEERISEEEREEALRVAKEQWHREIRTVLTLAVVIFVIFYIISRIT